MEEPEHDEAEREGQRECKRTPGWQAHGIGLIRLFGPTVRRRSGPSRMGSRRGFYGHGQRRRAPPLRRRCREFKGRALNSLTGLSIGQTWDDGTSRSSPAKNGKSGIKPHVEMLPGSTCGALARPSCYLSRLHTLNTYRHLMAQPTSFARAALLSVVTHVASLVRLGRWS